MAKRDRLEDLGRLFERLRVLHEHELFQEMSRFNKNYEIDEHLANCSEDERDNLVTNLRYWCNKVHEEIAACLCIAQADDEINYYENKAADGI
jgi:hypothetical protein